MDEELLKRNTDCVYFLASPFTCKKGAECDFRHSEMARLNPRDCWYWLSGSCLNPTCGFRHPPLEVQIGVSAESVSFPNHSSFPPSKNNIPCYFYFNGYCNKGDKCSFLHGPGDTSACKPNAESESNHMPPLDTKIVETSGTKTSIGTSDLNVQVKKLDAKMPIEKLDPAIPSRAVPLSASPEKYIPPMMMSKSVDATLMQQKQQVQQSVKYNIVELQVAQNGLASNREEAANCMYESLSPPENAVEPSLCSDQSSEDQIKGDVVHDEWCESSPGFDVLVDGRSQDMDYDYKDSQEYMLGYDDGYDGSDENHEHLFVDKGFDNRTVYGRRIVQENRMHEYSYYSDDDEHRFAFVHYAHCYRDRKLNHFLSKKRKLSTMDLPDGAHTTVDLRDHLSKRRLGDGHLESPLFRRRSLFFHAGARHQSLQRYGSGQFHGRLASRLGSNGVEFPTENSQLAAENNRGRAKNLPQNSFRRRPRERKRQHFSPQVPRGQILGRKKENEFYEFSSFSGPKSLAQIREEKNGAKENSSGFGITEQPRTISSVDFEGPKSLSEILKDKKRVG